MVGRISDPFQCICLADIESGDVRITQAKSLLQVGVSFKKILVSSNLEVEKAKGQFMQRGVLLAKSKNTEYCKRIDSI